MNTKMPKGSLSTDDFQVIHRHMKAGILLILIAGILITGCKHEWEKEEKHTIENDSIKGSFVSVADSISYGVVIRNRDESNEWQKKWLSQFDRKEFIDFIFDAVYSGKLKPYDYFDDEPLPIEEIRQLEKKEEFNRSKIGKIQFREKWYLDPTNLKMVKEVHSVMLAYEVYKDDGGFRGYKPAFRVILNTSIGD